MPAAVLFVSPDLMFASQAGGVVRRLGAVFQMLAAPGELAAKLNADVRLVICDAVAPGLDVAAVVQQVRSAAPQAAIVAYGAHVQAAKLDAARSAGCDEVLTRGQFHGGLEAILARRLAPPAP